jgi:proteasome beta subunit
VEYGVLAVVRVLDALKTSQPMVGGPLNIVRITSEGAHHLDDDEVEEVRSHVTRWQEADMETLDSILPGSS